MNATCSRGSSIGLRSLELEWRLVLEHGRKILIGERQDWGGIQNFGVAISDLRHHVYVIGKTGSGKTSLLRNMLIQHLQEGHGAGLIDPHGDLAEEIVNHFPSNRSNDLCYFNPSDLEFPTAFNPLFRVPRDERHLVASGIVDALKGIWRDSWGPRLEYILYNGLAALLDCENVSLLGLNRLLSDESYRAWVIRQIKDPFVRSFWAEEYAGYDTRFQREAIAPIQNKIGQFLLNPVARNILGQVKSKVSIPFVMDNERLFLANLSKGRIGHDKANLLGSLLVSQFQLAAMARANHPETSRRDYHLLIDEFHNFSTDAFSAILSEARKYRLCLVLSHQYVDQLSLAVRQAILGNVGTLIVFRVGHSDAEILEKEFGKVITASALADLDRYEAVVRLLENGTNREPFRAKISAPMRIATKFAKRPVQHSRKRFSASRVSVEGKLHRWISKD